MELFLEDAQFNETAKLNVRAYCWDAEPATAACRAAAVVRRYVREAFALRGLEEEAATLKHPTYEIPLVRYDKPALDVVKIGFTITKYDASECLYSFAICARKEVEGKVVEGRLVDRLFRDIDATILQIGVKLRED